MTALGPNLPNPIESKPDRELVRDGGVNAALEIIKRLKDTMDRLRTSVETFNKDASRQTDRMARLTIIIAVLAAIMTIGLAVQIFLALHWLPR